MANCISVGVEGYEFSGDSSDKDGGLSAPEDSRPAALVACSAILVVEDDEEVRENIALLLRYDGYKVLTAENGARALEILQRMPEPVLMLVDLTMPIMDGWHLIQHLRAHDRLAVLPVVILSGGPSRPAGYRHIKKPVDPEELLAIVAAHCDRSKA